MATTHKSHPTVSIIIPTYNYAQYIAEAINSALAQTYENIEILVIDDDSTDSTKQIVQEYKNKLRYYKVTHGGVSRARNFGVRKAKGEYIVFLDADDRLHNNYVQKTLDLIRLQKPQIGFVYTQLQYFGHSNYTTQYPGYKLDYLKTSNFIAVTCLIKASLFGQFTYDSKLEVWEDWDFYLTLAEHGIFGVLLNEPLLYYRKHADGKSALDTFTLKKQLHSAHLLRTKHWRMYGYVQTSMHWYWYISTHIKRIGVK